MHFLFNVGVLTRFIFLFSWFYFIVILKFPCNFRLNCSSLKRISKTLCFASQKRTSIFFALQDMCTRLLCMHRSGKSSHYVMSRCDMVIYPIRNVFYASQQMMSLSQRIGFSIFFHVHNISKATKKIVPR